VLAARASSGRGTIQRRTSPGRPRSAASGPTCLRRNTLQGGATRCKAAQHNSRQHNAARCSTAGGRADVPAGVEQVRHTERLDDERPLPHNPLQRRTARCNAAQPVAAPHNPLQRRTARCDNACLCRSAACAKWLAMRWPLAPGTRQAQRAGWGARWRKEGADGRRGSGTARWCRAVASRRLARRDKSRRPPRLLHRAGDSLGRGIVRATRRIRPLRGRWMRRRKERRAERAHTHTTRPTHAHTHTHARAYAHTHARTHTHTPTSTHNHTQRDVHEGCAAGPNRSESTACSSRRG
jgi:hypothetical protein